MITLDKPSNFIRCRNPVEVPESMCKLCLRTLVARDVRALELAEIRHNCAASDFAIRKND